jgi:hypothetical protein
MSRMQTFFVPTDEIGAAEGSRVGVGWLARLAAENVAGEPMIIVYAKSMAGNNEFMAAASATFRCETTRTWYGSPWSGGPVLALFPSRKALAQILERSHIITHLCVVESGGERPEAWLQAAKPTYIVGEPDVHANLDPVVIGALLSLTAFVNRAHYANIEDTAAGIRTCQELLQLGYALDPDAFEGFVLENHWDPDAAARFAETVRQVSSGHRFRNPDLRNWPAKATPKTRDYWREEGERYLADPSAVKAADEGI